MVLFVLLKVFGTTIFTDTAELLHLVGRKVSGALQLACLVGFGPFCFSFPFSTNPKYCRLDHEIIYATSRRLSYYCSSSMLPISG